MNRCHHQLARSATAGQTAASAHHRLVRQPGSLVQRGLGRAPGPGRRPAWPPLSGPDRPAGRSVPAGPRQGWPRSGRGAARGRTRRARPPLCPRRVTTRAKSESKPAPRGDAAGRRDAAEWKHPSRYRRAMAGTLQEARPTRTVGTAQLQQYAASAIHSSGNTQLQQYKAPAIRSSRTRSSSNRQLQQRSASAMYSSSNEQRVSNAKLDLV